jgi:spermidine synthase
MDHGGVISLRVNGKVDASNVGDMPMQLGSAYFPLFLAPGAEEALVIGYGSGTTAGTLLLKPDLRVTCAEIEPAVVEGAEHFSRVNHKPREHEPARFSIVNDDGRSFLQGIEKRYDLIISEPSNPWMAGVSSLFTREFYEIVRERLAPGGVLAQWVQGYAFTVAEYALVVRTLLSVFPEAMLVRILDGDTIILAASEPIAMDAGLCARAQSVVDASGAMRADLELHFGSADVRSLLLRHVILDRQGLLRLAEAAGPGPLNTDINLRLEFDAPRRLFHRPEGELTVPAGIFAAVEAQHFESLVRGMGAPRELAGAAHELAVLFASKSRQDLARKLSRLGLELDPGNVDLLTARLAHAAPDDAPSFDAVLEALVAAAGGRTLESLGLAGSRLYQAGHVALAARVFERIVALEPSSATAWANLGNARAELDTREEAAKALEKAAALDPLNDFVRKSLETLRKGEPKAKPGG